jgi:hypothetical protein
MLIVSFTVSTKRICTLVFSALATELGMY